MTFPMKKFFPTFHANVSKSEIMFNFSNIMIRV